MKSRSSILSRASTTSALDIVEISLIQPSRPYASPGVNDLTHGTSMGTVRSGVGTTVAFPPASTRQVQSLVTGTLAMTGSVYNGSTVQCTGTYRIDRYYPTLYLATVDLSLSAVSNSNGAPMFVTLNVADTVYPFLGGSFVIAGIACPLVGGSFVIGGTGGAAHTQAYISPGSIITGVTVMDHTGKIVASGK